METKKSAVDAFRFGYGLPGLADGFGSVDAMLDQLASAEPVPQRLRDTISAERLIRVAQDTMNVRQASKADRKKTRRILVNTRRDYYEGDAHDRLAAAVETRFPFFERLVSFWSGHFTVSIKQSGIRFLAGPYEVEAIRPFVMGTFRDLLRAVEFHPAMVIYLDLAKSVGPNSLVGKGQGKGSKGLNENLAREILELHTMGVNGGYNQDDVTSFAKIMTGWIVNRKEGRTEFNIRRAEPGGKILLGTRFGSERPDAEAYGQALDFLARHPSTAQFVATKLVRHFISDQPSEEAIGVVTNAFVESEGQLPVVYRSLVSLQDRGTGEKARTDLEFVVAALRAAQVSSEDLAPLERNGIKRPNPLSAGALLAMTQALWSAPSPAGWPDNAQDWLSPTGLAQRLGWIPRVVALVRDETAEVFLDRVLGPLASDQTRSVVRAASNREEGLGLVLASPEFNRR